MKKIIQHFSVGILLLSLGTVLANAQAHQELIESKKIVAGEATVGTIDKTTLGGAVGIFEKSVTYVYGTNNPAIRGGAPQARNSKAQYDPLTGEYLIQANGADVWDNEDQCFYAWTSRPRSYRMTGKFRYITDGGNTWAKQGISLRMEPEREDSAHVFFEYRGDEDGDEWGVRPLRTAATRQRLLDNTYHTSTQMPGKDNHEAIWMRLTRIWPANQFYMEDSNDGKTWELLNAEYAAGIPLPEAANWGIWAFDHEGSVDAAVDEALIRDIVLEPVVVGSRFFSETHFESGKAIDVKITLNNEGDAATANVTETVPTGWTIGTVSDGGKAAGSKITWSITNFKGLKDITYSITPAANAVRGDFTGDVNGIKTAGNVVVGVMPKVGGGAGDFPASCTIGSGLAGKVAYNGKDTYTVSGSGMIAVAESTFDAVDQKEDGLFFVYKQLAGDFSLEVGEIVITSPGPDNDTRVGIMMRDSLSTFSSYISDVVRADNSIRMETRDVSGNNAYHERGIVWYEGAPIRNEDQATEANHDSTNGMRIRREKGIVYVEYSDSFNPTSWTTYSGGTPVAGDPVYVGLIVNSNTTTDLAEATFKNVKVVGGIVGINDWALY